MKCAITILATLGFAVAILALVSVSGALAQEGGAPTLAEYLGALLTLVAGALGCAACALALASAARGPSLDSATAVTLAPTGAGPLAIVAAFYAVNLSGSAPLAGLMSQFDPTVICGVVCTLAIAAPLLALASSRRWRLAGSMRAS